MSRPLSFLALSKLILGLAFSVGMVLPAHAISVLVWSTGHYQEPTDAMAVWIKALGGFDRVDAFEGDSRTFAQLDAYDRVLYFSNSGGDPVGIGNVLADFADTGKRLVLTTFSWSLQGPNTLGGRLLSDALSPYSAAGLSLYTTVSMASNDGSDFFEGVSSLTGYYHDDVALVAGATSRAWWSDGQSLLAQKANVVGVNLFPDDSYGRIGGDNRRLFVNALGVDLGSRVPEPSSLLLVGLALASVSLGRHGRVRT